jgi:hypothetical protein
MAEPGKWRSVRIVTPAGGIPSGGTATCRYFRYGSLSPSTETLTITNKFMGAADGNRMGYAIALEGIWQIIALDCQTYTTPSPPPGGSGTGTGTTSGAGNATLQAAMGAGSGSGSFSGFGRPPRIGTSMNASASGGRRQTPTPPPPPP